MTEGATDAWQRTARAFVATIESGRLDIPLPGSGRTRERWAAFADLAEEDLSLARLGEGHADAAEPVPHLTEAGWHDLMSAAELDGLPDRQPVRRMLGDVSVVVIRDGQHTHVLADRCSHLSGPLSDGEYRDG